MFKWLNRRSQKQSYNWEEFKKKVEYSPLISPSRIDDLKQLGWNRIYTSITLGDRMEFSL